MHFNSFSNKSGEIQTKLKKDTSSGSVLVQLFDLNSFRFSNQSLTKFGNKPKTVVYLPSTSRDRAVGSSSGS